MLVEYDVATRAPIGVVFLTVGGLFPFLEQTVMGCLRFPALCFLWLFTPISRAFTSPLEALLCWWCAAYE